MEQIVDLVAHKNPDISILQLGASLEVKTKVLSALNGDHHQGTNRYSKYTVAAIDSTDIGDSVSASEDPEELVTKFRLEKGPSLGEQGLELSSTDLIIITADFDLPDEVQSLLNDVVNLLRDGGIVLLSQTSESISNR